MKKVKNPRPVKQLIFRKVSYFDGGVVDWEEIHHGWLRMCVREFHLYVKVPKEAQQLDISLFRSKPKGRVGIVPIRVEKGMQNSSATIDEKETPLDIEVCYLICSCLPKGKTSGMIYALIEWS
jgi:hypothetical protein